MMRTAALVLASVLWLLSGLAAAQPLDDLKAFYRDVTSLSGDFEQRLLDEDGETLERYAGRFWMQRPGRFLWRYDTPYEQQLGSDGDTLWHYDVDLRQVTKRDAKTSLSGTPAELLGGDLSQLDSYQLTRLEDEDGLQWLQLLPNSDSSDFAQIRIGLAQGQPTKVVLSDRLGQTTAMTLHDLKRNPDTDATLFELRVPEGVTVVDERSGR